MCNVKRMGKYAVSHGHGHSSEIHGPRNGVGGPCNISSCSYGGCRGQDHACLSHSSKRARRSISPRSGPIRSYRSERSPSFDHIRHYAKGADRQRCQARSCRHNFSETDAARHRSYMHKFHSSNKHEGHSQEDPLFNISVCTSHGRSCERDEIIRAQPKGPVDECPPIHHELLEFSPNENFHEWLDSSRNFRNIYNGKMVKRKCIKQGFHKSTYNGACASKNGRNSSGKRNADHLDGKKAGENVIYKEKSKRLCCPNEQGQQPQIESGGRRNDSGKENDEITKLVGQNGAKGDKNPKNVLTAPALSGSTECDENSNMLSHKYRSKTIASSNTPKLSEGINIMELEYDKQSSVDGCTKRGILQHLRVTHTKKSVQPKESDNLSHAEVLRRDCLNLWRARRSRKDAAEADKIVKADQQQNVHRSKVSTSGRVTNGRPASCASSKSNDEDDSASESSDQFSSALSSEGLQKCDEGSADKKSQRPLRFPSSCKCNKSPQNRTTEKGLMCNRELPPGANPGEIAQQKEQEKLLFCQLSTDHSDAKVQASWNAS